MNFTDKYIKMCDCDEVQRHRPEMFVLESMRPASHFVPYQHEVQSLIHSYVNCAFRLLQDFYHWCEAKQDYVKGATFEELWLMFYMWREHYKVWDGDKWIKEKKKYIKTEKK